MMAATNVTFSQVTVSDRETFLQLCDSLLPFQQLPVLQIDGHVLAQSHAIVRYLAKRGDIAGINSLQSVQMDMIAEYTNEMMEHVINAPFIRTRGGSEWEDKLKIVRVKWGKYAHKVEQILQQNSNTVVDNDIAEVSDSDSDKVVFLVGSSMSYVDVLVSHLLTWAVEEFGNIALEVVRTTPKYVDLQRFVLSLPQVDDFLRSDLYYPIGDDSYVQSVQHTLGRS